MEKLDETRKKINAIDAQIADLFEQRMLEVRSVVEYKMANGLPIIDEKREQDVIRNNAALVKDDEIREYHIEMQKTMMALSKDYQRRIMKGMKIAVRGGEDSLCADAARHIFPDAQIVSFKTFESAWEACENGECDAAVLPMENNQSGETGAVTDLMFSGSLYVNQVVEIESEGTTTRFGAFSRALDTNSDKSSRMGRRFILMYTVRNEAGSLAQTLNIIGAHSYNMCNLRSRPMKDLMWNYYFLVELEGDVNTAEGHSLLRELGSLCERLKLAGAFHISH